MMLRSLLLLAQHAALSRAAEGGYGAATVTACSDHDFVDRTAAVNAECCNEKAEDCSSGRPTTCNPGCARVLLPYFADCQASLGLFAADFADVVALCHAAGAAEPSATTPPSADAAFPGSRIITAEWARALTGFIGEGAPTRWSRCYDSFTMDARTPATFHENCDAHSTTLIVAHNTGGSYNDGRRTITNAGGKTFGGYVRCLTWSAASSICLSPATHTRI